MLSPVDFPTPHSPPRLSSAQRVIIIGHGPGNQPIMDLIDRRSTLYVMHRDATNFIIEYSLRRHEVCERRDPDNWALDRSSDTKTFR